jgi:hypothetical protein
VSETETEKNGAEKSGAVKAVLGEGAEAGGPPRPEPIRFFGTSWVAYEDGYWWRRAVVPIGALLATVAGAFVLRLGFQGLTDADIGPFVTGIAVVGFAVCSALAFQRTWRGFTRRRATAEVDGMRGLLAIGFLGSLLAYFLRSMAEAPGEKLHRAEFEQAREQYEKRRKSRSGNPASGRRKRKRR